MPWNASDVERFKKGLSRKQKRKWASIANGALASCMEGGGSDKECSGRAVRIANSKFEDNTPFNPVMNPGIAKELKKMSLQPGDVHVPSPDWNGEEKFEPPEAGDAPKGVKDILANAYSNCRKSNPDYSKERCSKISWGAVHNAGYEKNKEGRWVKGESSPAASKKFQNKRITPPDAINGHFHEASYDENGNGATNLAGAYPHHHVISNFRILDFYYMNPDTREEYHSSHPGSLAFAELGECEMEIFRPGTHNGDEFGEMDLEEIASNFKRLAGELRPKLKITHREKQESLAGLASYGDVADVFLKKVSDGTRRLFARIVNIPKQVSDWIKERRFPDRSIELYPEFKVGTKEDSPTYRNVLKAVALLGHEMPAVVGMEPVTLEECLECQNTTRLTQSFEEEHVPKELELAFQMAGSRLNEIRREVNI